MSKVAIVTGASRGLGAALAEALAKDHHVIAIARTSGGLEDLDDRIRAAGGSATLVPVDLADSDACAAVCRSIRERWGHADLWVHAAVHVAPLAPAAHLDPKDLAKSLETNVAATATLIACLAPLLEAAEDGTAVFFDDPRAGERFFSAYGATKAAQVSLARCWAAETARTGPRVMILSPPPMPTATRARFFPGENRSALTPPGAAALGILAAIG
ncbi:MAG: SDR family oxidoreductase [Boseongicola sp. SB0675_bin_26]|nr:SDR family oxidoreductase [Boseongicola sp. SB0675_bin_26]